MVRQAMLIIKRGAGVGACDEAIANCSCDDATVRCRDALPPAVASAEYDPHEYRRKMDEIARKEREGSLRVSPK